jgi:hypothetical protein
MPVLNYLEFAGIVLHLRLNEKRKIIIIKSMMMIFNTRRLVFIPANPAAGANIFACPGRVSMILKSATMNRAAAVLGRNYLPAISR